MWEGAGNFVVVTFITETVTDTNLKQVIIQHTWSLFFRDKNNSCLETPQHNFKPAISHNAVAPIF